MIYVFIFVTGIILGVLLERILIKNSHIGILRIDNSDGDGPYLFLELSKKKRVLIQETKTGFYVCKRRKLYFA